MFYIETERSCSRLEICREWLMIDVGRSVYWQGSSIVRLTINIDRSKVLLEPREPSTRSSHFVPLSFSPLTSLHPFLSPVFPLHRSLAFSSLVFSPSSSRARGGRGLSKNRRASNNEPGAAAATAAAAARVEVCIVNAYTWLLVSPPSSHPGCNRRFDPMTQRTGPKYCGNARTGFTLDPGFVFTLILSLSLSLSHDHLPRLRSAPLFRSPILSTDSGVPPPLTLMIDYARRYKYFVVVYLSRARVSNGAA